MICGCDLANQRMTEVHYKRKNRFPTDQGFMPRKEKKVEKRSECRMRYGGYQEGAVPYKAGV